MNFIKQLFKTKISIVTTLRVTSANGFHLRPIAKFVNEVKKFEATVSLFAHGTEVLATQVPKVLSLSLEKGDTFSLKCKGKEAKEASQALTSFFEQLMKEDTTLEELVQEQEAYESPTLKGVSIASGVLTAPLVKLLKNEISNSKEALTLKDAIEETKKELETLSKQTKDGEIFLAQKELLSSVEFSKIDEEIEKLKGSKFESRIADYKDLKERVSSHMGTSYQLNLPSTPSILLANELLPSEIEQVKNSQVKGVVLQSGTSTSHASILLRSAGITSIIVHELIQPSNLVILDANSGDLILNPNEADKKRALEKQKAFEEASNQSFEKRFEATSTKGKRSIKVLANITNLDSAKEAKELGADGVGLLRTEFLFTEQKPTIEEQTKAYSSIFELFDEVTVRTLDIGGDKSLPYINIEKEDNPFLGIRGIRFSLQEQTLFKEQLLAIGKALLNSKVKIMFPMVSTLEEFKEAKNIALEIYKKNNISLNNIEFGIMLEVPSVIFALEEFDKLVDFYSIGSNDLGQYLFAVERTHPTLKVDDNSPLLLNALRYIRKNTQKPISICGELAGKEELTEQLITMNYNTLSVSAKLIPSLKEKIRNV